MSPRNPFKDKNIHKSSVPAVGRKNTSPYCVVTSLSRFHRSICCSSKISR